MTTTDQYHLSRIWSSSTKLSCDKQNLVLFIPRLFEKCKIPRRIYRMRFLFILALPVCKSRCSNYNVTSEDTYIMVGSNFPRRHIGLRSVFKHPVIDRNNLLYELSIWPTDSLTKAISLFSVLSRALKLNIRTLAKSKIYQ